MQYRVLYLWLFLSSFQVESFGSEPILPYDTLLLDSLLELSFNLSRSQPDSAVALAQGILAVAAKNDDLFRQGESYLNIGAATLNKGDFANTLPYLQKAEKYYRAVNRPMSVSTVYMRMGTLYKRQARLTTALDYQIKALNIRDSLQSSPEAIGACYNNIGNLYRELGDYPQALAFMKKAVGSFVGEKNNWPRAIVLGNVGLIFSKKGELDSAEVYMRQSLAIHQDMDNRREEGRLHLLIGEMYFDNRLFERAVSDLLQAESILAGQQDRFLYSLVVQMLGKVHYEQQAYAKAVPYLRQSRLLADELGAVSTKSTSSRYLALSLSEQGRYEEAFPYLLEHNQLADSIYQLETSEKIAEQKTRFETDLKEQQITNLEQREAQRRRERNLGFITTLLLGILGGIIFYIAFLRKQAYRKLSAEKERSDQLLHNLQTAQSQIIQTEKMASLGQLTAGVAHEINNPINFIGSSIEALKYDLDDLRPLFDHIKSLDIREDAKKQLADLVQLRNELDLPFLTEEIKGLTDSINKGVSRTREIVIALRAFSRQSNGVLLPADIHEGIDSSLIILNHKLGDGITVQKNYGELPPIPCQSSRLNQVFLNLLDNAIHALNGQGHIFIKTKMENGQAVISIRDNGEGMDEAVRKRIFEPFFTTKEIGEGTGLGLAISYGIVKDHGGRIEVKSAEGEGTEFLVWLPG